MASSDLRIRPIYSTSRIKVATYSNAHYDIDGQEPYLCRMLDEDDLRKISITQILDDLWDEDGSVFRTRGVAKIKVIPSASSTPPVIGGEVPSTLLEDRLMDLYGKHRDFDFLTGYVEQRVTFQDEDAGFKLPDGMIAINNGYLGGPRMNMGEFFECLHSQGRFAPLTGFRGDVLGTYWEKMQDDPYSFNLNPPLYCPDVRASPTHMSKWALDFSDLGKDNPFTNILVPSLKRGPGYQWFIPGIQSPMSYIAGAGSFFSMHKEDMDLLSMNVHLGGFPKIWYIIRPQSVVDLHQAVKYCVKLGYDKNHYHNICKDPMRHRAFLFSPSWLREWGIHHDVIIQKPNEIVITLPLGAHQGVNIGPMVNEAINLVTPQWLPYGKRATECTCDYTDFHLPEFSILPFVSEWESEERGTDFIKGLESGNTVITDADQGYLPGTGSKRVQKRHLTTMNKTDENAYMFRAMDFAQDNVDRPGEKYYNDGRLKSLLKLSKLPKARGDLVDEEISKMFEVDEETIIRKSCKTLSAYRIAQYSARKLKTDYLKKTNRKSVFDTYRDLYHTY